MIICGDSLKMNENSLQAYYSEIGSLNKNRRMVFRCIDEHPNLNCEALMLVMKETERNKIAPRISDLLKLGLIEVVGSVINTKGHTESTFHIVESNEFKAPKTTDLKSLFHKLDKYSDSELEFIKKYIERKLEE